MQRCTDFEDLRPGALWSAVFALSLLAAACGPAPIRPNPLRPVADAPGALIESGRARMIAGEVVGAAMDFRAGALRLAPGAAGRQAALLLEGLLELIAADFAAAEEALLLAVEDAPNRPLAWLAAVELREVCSELAGGHERIRERLERILASGGASAAVALGLRVILREAAARRGDFDALRRIDRELGVVACYRAAYPLPGHPLIAFDEEPDHLDPLPATAERIVWADGDRLVFAAEIPAGLLQIEARFALRSAATLCLSVDGQAAWAAYVDGRPLGRHPSHRAHLPSQERRCFEAGPGPHALAFRLPVQGASLDLGVRLSPASGAAADFDWECPPPKGGGAYSSRGFRALAGEASPAALLESEARDAPGEPTRALLAALGLWNAGDREAAALMLERAGEGPLPRYLAGLLALEDPDLPPGIDAVRSRELFEAAAARSRDALLPRLHLAALDGEQSQEERALRTLSELDLRRPTAYLWPYFAGMIEERMGFADEARRSYLRAIERQPDAVLVIRRLLGLARRRQALAEAERLSESLLALGQEEEEIAQFWAERGRRPERRALLEKIVSKARGRLAPRLELADLTAALGDRKAARRLLDEAWTLDPGRVETWARRADLLDRAPRSEKAKASLRSLVAAHPWYLPAWRALAALEGQTAIVLPGDRRENAAELLAAYRKHGPPAEVGSVVLLLDQSTTVIGLDGSSALRVHTVAVIASPEGLEEWGEIDELPAGAEIEALRTHRADGKIIEAEPIPGKDSITMPGLQVGDAVEIAYITGQRPAAPIPGAYIGRPFLLQVQGSAIVQSRYTVARPAGMPVRFEVQGAVERRSFREGAFEITTFERRDVPPLQAERNAPAFQELVPQVLTGVGIGWRDERDALRAALTLAARETPGIARFAHEASGQGPLRERVRRLYRRTLAAVRQTAGTSDVDDIAAYALARGEGNRLVLLYATLRALGLAPRLLLARPPSAAYRDTDLPIDDTYTYGLCALTLPGGETLWLDPSSAHNAYGRLYPFLWGARALDVTGDGEPFTRLPDGPADSLEKRIELELALTPDGTLAGSGVETITTTEAVRYRELLSGMSEDQRRQALEAGLVGSFTGAMLERYELRNLDNPDEPLGIAYSFRAPGHARKRGDDLVLQGGFFPYQLGQNLVTGPSRETPLLLGDLTRTRTRVRVSLPSGARAELDPPVRLGAEGAEFTLALRQNGLVLEIDKRLVVPPGRIRPSDYPAFRRFCLEADARDRAPIRIRLGGQRSHP